MRERAIEWLKAADVAAHWSSPVGVGLSAGQHQAGTCRMSLSPASGVTDPMGRVHGHRNLFVADGSLHVTNGGFNPVLTIMALAFKVADHVNDSL
jgi:choline dehydrogenase-like flavoprotein